MGTRVLLRGSAGVASGEEAGSATWNVSWPCLPRLSLSVLRMIANFISEVRRLARSSHSVERVRRGGVSPRRFVLQYRCFINAASLGHETAAERGAEGFSGSRLWLILNGLFSISVSGSATVQRNKIGPRHTRKFQLAISFTIEWSEAQGT